MRTRTHTDTHRRRGKQRNPLGHTAGLIWDNTGTTNLRHPTVMEGSDPHTVKLPHSPSEQNPEKQEEPEDPRNDPLTHKAQLVWKEPRSQKVFPNPGLPTSLMSYCSLILDVLLHTVPKGALVWPQTTSSWKGHPGNCCPAS